MNAQSIWVGNWYAWCRYGKPKGVTFVSSHVYKVRALKLTKEKSHYSERASTYVTVEDEDGRIFQARARDILSFWEDYEAQLKQHERERAERDALRRKEEEERTKDYEEIKHLMDSYGIIGYRNAHGRSVTLSFDEFKKLVHSIG